MADVDPMLAWLAKAHDSNGNGNGSGNGSHVQEEVEVPSVEIVEVDEGQAWKEARRFPLDVLPETLREYALAVAADVCVDVDVVAAAMLPVAAACVGGSRSVRVKGTWHEYPVLWLGLVGPPGARKSPALKRLVGPLNEFERQAREAHTQAHAAWQGLDRAARAQTPEPRLERLVVSDITIEALGGLLNDAPLGLLIYRDELSGWADSMGQYKAGRSSDDRQKWLELWDVKPLRVDRAGHSFFVQRPLVNLVGGIQPDLVSRIAGDRGNDGLADRFVFVAMRDVEVVFDTPETPAGLEAAWGRTAERLLRMRLVEKCLELDEHAVRVARRAYNKHYAERKVVQAHFPWRLGFWSKADALASRVAVILACLRSACDGDREESVTAQDVEAAWQVVDWAKYMHVLVAGESAPLEYERAGPSVERKTIEWLAKRAPNDQGEIVAKLRDVYKGPCQRLERKEVFRILDTLRDRGLIELRSGVRSDQTLVVFRGSHA